MDLVLSAWFCFPGNNEPVNITNKEKKIVQEQLEPKPFHQLLTVIEKRGLRNETRTFYYRLEQAL